MEKELSLEQVVVGGHRLRISRRGMPTVLQVIALPSSMSKFTVAFARKVTNERSLLLRPEHVSMQDDPDVMKRSHAQIYRPAKSVSYVVGVLASRS